MTRPDPQRIAKNSLSVIGGAGEVATYRKWISAGSGAAQFGVQNQNYYVETLVTGLFDNFDPRLARAGGGQYQQTIGGGATQGLSVSLPFQMSPRDEIIWEGSAYRVDGNADHETFGWGHVLFSHPLKLANITG